MIPEIAWSFVFEATPNDPGAGGGVESCGAGVGGVGLEISFLTTMGGSAVVSTGFLTTVSGATIEVDFFGVGGCASVVERVISGPSSTGSALDGCEDVVAAGDAGLAEGGTAVCTGGCAWAGAVRA